MALHARTNNFSMRGMHERRKAPESEVARLPGRGKQRRPKRNLSGLDYRTSATDALLITLNYSVAVYKSFLHRALLALRAPLTTRCRPPPPLVLFSPRRIALLGRKRAIRNSERVSGRFKEPEKLNGKRDAR